MAPKPTHEIMRNILQRIRRQRDLQEAGFFIDLTPGRLPDPDPKIEESFQIRHWINLNELRQEVK